MSVIHAAALAGVTPGARRAWAASPQQTIPEVLQAVRASLQPLSAVGYLGCRSQLGNDGSQIADGVQQWTDYAGQLLALAQGHVDQQLRIPLEVGEGIAQSLLALQQYAIEAGRAGATAGGELITGITERVANAWETLGTGAGNAFASFWGFRPGDPLKAAGGLVLVALLAGLGILAFTTGGQSLIASIGKGYGSALGSVGSGAGKAIGTINPIAMLR